MVNKYEIPSDALDYPGYRAFLLFNKTDENYHSIKGASASPLDLSTGDIDKAYFVLPCEIKRLIHEALDAGETGYSRPGGKYDAREALAALESKTTDIPYVADNVILTAGVTAGITATVFALTRGQKKGVIVVSPTYFCLVSIAHCFGRARLLEAIPSNNFVPLWEDVKQHIDQDTICILLTNPGNPSGCLVPREDLKRIIDICESKHIFLILDETSDNYYSAGPPLTYRSYKDMPYSKCVIRLRNFAKEIGIAGFRIGYVIADPKLIEIICRCSTYFFVNATPILNRMLRAYCHAILAEDSLAKLAGDGSEHIDKTAQQYRSICNDLITFHEKVLTLKILGIDILKTIPRVKKIIVPDSSINMLAKLELPCRSFQFYEHLLFEKDVAVAPGPCFGLPDEDGWIRITFAADPEKVLIPALERMKEFLSGI